MLYQSLWLYICIFFPLNILLSYTQVIPLQQLSRQRRYKLFLSFMVLVLLLAKSVNFVDEAGDFSPRVSFNLYINYRKYKKVSRF